MNPPPHHHLLFTVRRRSQLLLGQEFLSQSGEARPRSDDQPLARLLNSMERAGSMSGAVLGLSSGNARRKSVTLPECEDPAAGISRLAAVDVGQDGAAQSEPLSGRRRGVFRKVGNHGWMGGRGLSVRQA